MNTMNDCRNIVNKIIKKLDCIYRPFKVVSLDKKLYYDINFNWTITQFLNIMIQRIKQDIQEIRDEEIEILISCQTLKEFGEKITPDDKTKLFDKYKMDLFECGFYIRTPRLIKFLEIKLKLIENNINNKILNILFNSSNITSTIIILENQSQDCCICYDNKKIFYNINNCNHQICIDCYLKCYITKNTKCPICRNCMITI